MADGGFLRKGKKSGIVKCLYDVDRCVSVPSNVTVTVYDMLAVAHIVNPCDKGYKFADFTPKCLVPYLMRNTSASVTQIDAVWDTYPDENTTKELTRYKH